MQAQVRSTIQVPMLAANEEPGTWCDKVKIASFDNKYDHRGLSKDQVATSLHRIHTRSKTRRRSDPGRTSDVLSCVVRVPRGWVKRGLRPACLRNFPSYKDFFFLMTRRFWRDARRAAVRTHNVGGEHIGRPKWSTSVVDT